MCAASLNAAAHTARDAYAACVPRELARPRAAHYRDVRYSLDLTLAPGAETLKGRETIAVTLDEAAGDLVLDWRVIKNDVDPSTRVGGIKVNGRAVTDAQFRDEHIRIPRAHLST